MLDFTSALYLGLRHPSQALQPWEALTQGRPAILDEPRGAAAVATRLARLQGCEAALLVPSTLHAFWDLFYWLSREPVDVLVEDGTYPIARWGTLAAMAHGAGLYRFARHDAAAVVMQFASRAQISRRRLVIVVDGFSPSAASAAPLQQYAELAKKYGGFLVIDDTQALGILGVRKDNSIYGMGGGGSLCWHGISGPHIILGASLAKAFGAPVAALSGSRAVIAGIRESSPSRTHCSPPSQAVIAAARRALDFNRTCGDDWRDHLAALTTRLREQLRRIGLQPVGSLPFPAQSFAVSMPVTVDLLVQLLSRCGIRALHTRPARQSYLTFLLTAHHRSSDIDLVCAVLARGIPQLLQEAS